ncbi:MAG TPA: substrate-binding domain-containing protein [Solirubrobacteraceae bacterium]|nr:substrate-binding domain-containing protein [Solirubrobacteraceae bacterium]
MSRITRLRPAAFLAAVLALSLLVAAGCGSSNSSTSSGSTSASGQTVGNVKGGIAVLLPDSKSSVRWETQDRPDLDKAFTAAGIPHTIVNAEGDAAAQRTQADQALTNGAKVVLLVDLDSGSGSSIIAAAHKAGAKVIDYDRLTLGGGADYYVSFDNQRVGKLQGLGLVKCLSAGTTKTPVVAELNGSPTDNNATLFADGYNSVLNPLYAKGALKKGPNQSVPDWDNQQALTIYEQMLQSTNNKIDGVLAANDGLANSVISAQQARKLPKIPVTGQDATAQGIQHILSGDQCMTVYKNVNKEAASAAAAAIALIKGQKPASTTTLDNKSGKPVAASTSGGTPAILLTPQSVTKKNINSTVIKDGFLKASDICTGQYAQYCKQAGIQ